MRDVTTNLGGDWKARLDALQEAGGAPYDEAVAELLADFGALVAERRATFTGLDWFMATSIGLQAELLHLPGPMHVDDCSVALAELAEADSRCGDVVVTELKEIGGLEAGRIFGLYLVFGVKHDRGYSFDYQFHMWRQGRMSGVKGVVVLVDEAGHPSHIVTVRKDSFAQRRPVFGGVGGFAEVVDMASIAPLLARMQTEMEQELGLDMADCRAIVRLGTTVPDEGLSQQAPQLFAACFPAALATKLSKVCVNPDPHEMRVVPAVFRIEDLWGEDGALMGSLEDAFVQSVLLRLVSLGFLQGPSARPIPMGIPAE